MIYNLNEEYEYEENNDNVIDDLREAAITVLEYCEYLEEEGAIDKLYKHRKEKIEDAERKYVTYNDLAHSDTSDNTKKQALSKAEKYGQEYDRLRKVPNRKYSLKYIYGLKGDTDNSNKIDRQSAKRAMGQGKNNMPKDREPGTYLQAYKNMHPEKK